MSEAWRNFTWGLCKPDSAQEADVDRKFGCDSWREKKQTALDFLNQKQICLHDLRGLWIKNRSPVIWPGVRAPQAFLFLWRKKQNKTQAVQDRTDLISTPAESGIPQSSKQRQHFMLAVAPALFWCYQSFPGQIMEFIICPRISGSKLPGNHCCNQIWARRELNNSERWTPPHPPTPTPNPSKQVAGVVLI